MLRGERGDRDVNPLPIDIRLGCLQVHRDRVRHRRDIFEAKTRMKRVPLIRRDQLTQAKQAPHAEHHDHPRERVLEAGVRIHVRPHRCE
jgi:hypothetical protein